MDQAITHSPTLSLVPIKISCKKKNYNNRTNKIVTMQVEIVIG